MLEFVPWQDEKQEEVEFCFDRVFYQGSEQADIYEFIALPIVRGENLFFFPIFSNFFYLFIFVLNLDNGSNLTSYLTVKKL